MLELPTLLVNFTIFITVGVTVIDTDYGFVIFTDIFPVRFSVDDALFVSNDDSVVATDVVTVRFSVDNTFIVAII